ncbi:autotransporter outer membrane beta-barrel domain-containing protein [Brucella sp. 2716]|uniref:autotransporter outer membrane beta-barrel domain-containing protein n=1 Tax=Brucella sp. 2716 TaxID=2975052 RepID=UPI00217D3A35|nr:autotransporter outer membrane beta-barrel domain-containing protein [Brucella sp. 2716]UWF60410.1 autotransporter outer membrane beta-barrel domain-containing protein [Brucella sp. 2716]
MTIALLQLQPTVHADEYLDDGPHTISADVTSCNVSTAKLGNSFTGLYDNSSCMMAIGLDNGSSVTFDGNVTYDVSGIKQSDDHAYFAGLSPFGSGKITVKGDYTITGLGAPGNNWKSPQAAISSYNSMLGINTPAWVTTKVDLEGNLSVDGGILFYQGASNTSQMSTVTPMMPENAGSLTVGGTTTMRVSPNATMFYSNGSAALVAPMTFNDIAVVFNGAVDFDLPLLAPSDSNGNQSVYGAILMAGPYVSLNFNSGGQYGLAQQYQPGLSGVVNLSDYDSKPVAPYPATYGWVMLSGVWDSGGKRAGTWPFYAPSVTGVASFSAQHMTLNYSMSGDGPPGIWGVVSLNQHAQATLTDSVMNLDMQGSASSRASVFVSGITPYALQYTSVGNPIVYYDNAFNLDHVTVHFNGDDSGKYVSFFDIDSTNATAEIKNNSHLVAPDNSAIADRSLIYINQTMQPPKDPYSGNPSYFLPKNTTFSFHATDSQLGGGIYVDILNSMGYFTSPNSLTFTIDGTTTWRGDIFVASAKDANVPDRYASATMTIGGSSHWTGQPTSNNGNITLTLRDRAIWTPTANVTGASFVGKKISVNGGTIQGDDRALQFDNELTLSVGSKGIAIDTNGQTITFASSLVGTGSLTKRGDGILFFNGGISSGGAILEGGVFSVYDGRIMVGKTPLNFNGGVLQVTGTTVQSTSNTINWLAAGGGFDIADAGNTFTVDQDLGAGGALTKLGDGTLVLSGTNSYKDGTNLNAGTLSVSSDVNLGDVSGLLNFRGGTLQITNTMSSMRNVALSADGGGTIAVDDGKNATFNGVFANASLAKGSFTKAGGGTLIMTATNTYTGGTTVSGGILQLGDGTTDGSIVGKINLGGGSLVVNNIGSTTLDDAISGAGSLTQANTGTLTLSGNNSAYSGDINLNAGTISVEQDKNIGTGALDFNGGTLLITGTDFNSTNNAINWNAGGGSFDIADAGNTFAISNIFTGSGGLTKLGGGTLALSGDSGNFTGDTNVNEGQLRLDGGSLGGAVNVASGASLGGNGAIGGATTIADGGSLFGQTGQKLAFGQGLTLGANSNVNVKLSDGSSTQALFDITGNLALDSTLNIEQDSAIGVGIYRIFDYSGTRTGTITIGTVPNGSNISDFELQTSVEHQVNLISTGGRNFFFWDGDAGPKNDGIIQGGDGTWNGTNDNWTNVDGSVNSIWHNNSFVVFGNDPSTGQDGGHVIIDSGLTPSINGMQFTNTGYRLSGGPINLGGDGDPIIVVGNGSIDSVNVAAEINSVIEGNEGLVKSGLGNLILTGQNTYTGDTTVTQGALTLGDGGNIDASSNIILASTRYGYGNLVIDKGQDFTLNNEVSGFGTVTKDGTGTTTFAGNNTFDGGLTVKAGTAKAGIADNAFGSGNVSINDSATLDLADFDETVGNLLGNKAGDGNINLGSGTLTLNQDLHADFSGVISGTGGLTKTGDGDLVLYGQNSYSGATAINHGALIQGTAGGFSSNSTYSVAQGADIELGGITTNMAGLSNSGNIIFGGTGGTLLNISGDYVGNDGTLHMSAVLGGDNSLTDKLNVGGSTSGTSRIDITNRQGFGDKTNNGIEIVRVGGDSNGTFTLNGDYTTKDGQQAIMTDSAYAYTLKKGGTNTPGDGNWYLVSQYDKPDPNPDCEETDTCYNPPDPDPSPDRFSAAAPVYESYISTLQALTKLPTLLQRVGERHLGDSTADQPPSVGEMGGKVIWGRIEGAHNRLENGSTAGDLHQNIDILIMQAGVDGQFYEGENGRLLAGITGQYSNARSDIDNRTGDGSGSINTQGWGLGLTATWYGSKGFYLDAQAQANWYDSDLNIDATNPILKDDSRGFGYALSLEAGRRFVMDQNWSLTPQAQLMWSSVDFDTFRDSYSAQISRRDGDSLTARLGLATNYASSFIGSNGRLVNISVYGIANFYQKLIDDARIDYAGTHMGTYSDDSWGGIGGGATYAWADNKYVLYGEGSINTSLNHFADSYILQGNIGLKVRW